MNDLYSNISYISKHHHHYLMNFPNVQGVGLGHKFINGYNTKEPSIHVLVNNKLPLNSLNCNYIIPKTYMGIKTDVIDLGGRIYTHSLKGKVRPLVSGYSIGASLYNKTGTFGCIVFRRKLVGKTYYILSNNHVLAENGELPKGTNIIQPSHEDGGRAYDDGLVGNLSEFVPLHPKSLIHQPVNYVDAAIAKVTKSNLISNQIALIGKLKGVSYAILDENVRKAGRTTGLTEGKVRTINATLTINDGSKELLYKNQIEVDIDQDYGDSGSILVNKENKVIGLFIGGSRYKGTFNDFNNVLKYTKTELYI